MKKFIALLLLYVVSCCSGFSSASYYVTFATVSIRFNASIPWNDEKLQTRMLTTAYAIYQEIYQNDKQ